MRHLTTSVLFAIPALALPALKSDAFWACRDGIPSESWEGWKHISRTAPATDNIFSLCSQTLDNLDKPACQDESEECHTSQVTSLYLQGLCGQRCFLTSTGQPSEHERNGFQHLDRLAQDYSFIPSIEMEEEGQIPADESKAAILFPVTYSKLTACQHQSSQLCVYVEHWVKVQIAEGGSLDSIEDLIPSKANQTSSSNSSELTEQPTITSTDIPSATSDPLTSSENEAQDPSSPDLKARWTSPDPLASKLAQPPSADQGGERGPGISGNIGTYPHSHTEQTILSVGCLLLGVTLSIVGSALSWQDKGLTGQRGNNGRDFI